MQEPQRDDESDEEFRRRIHWKILTPFGVPPLFAVRLWVKDGKPPILPPSEVLEEYLGTYEGRPLGDGEPDERITSGEGEKVLEIVRELEAEGGTVGGSSLFE